MDRKNINKIAFQSIYKHKMHIESLFFNEKQNLSAFIAHRSVNLAKYALSF